MKSKLKIPKDLIAQLRQIGIDPVDMVLYIDSVCNLRCSHCYIGNELLDKAILLEAESIRTMLRQIPRLARITILGGEPFLHPDFNYIIDALKNLEVREKRVTTNLTSLQGIDIDQLKELNVRVCVSIDGHDAISHDSIRGAGAFEKTIENVEKLVNHCLDIEVTHTLNSRNIFLFEEFIKLCRQLGIRRLNLHRISLRGNALINSILEVSAEKWVDLVRELESWDTAAGALSVRYEVGFVSHTEFQRLVSSGEYNHHAQGSYYAEEGGHRIVIYPNGRLYVSSEAFGTESHFGSFDKGYFEYNTSDLNELILSGRKDFNITDINSSIAENSDHLVPLSVSFRRKVTI